MSQNAQQIADGMYEDNIEPKNANPAPDGDTVIDTNSLPKPAETPETKPDESAEPKPEETTAEKPEETTEPEPEEDIVEEVIEEIEPKPAKDDRIPLATFLELKSDLKKTRDELNQIKGRQEGFEQAITKTTTPPTDKPTTIRGICQKYDLDPKDPLPAEVQEELENNRRETAENQQRDIQRESQRQINEKVAKDSAIAESRYAKGKVPPGQDYETITRLGMNLLTAADKRMLPLADNPAIELYKRCKVRVAEAIPSLKEQFLQASAKSPLKQAQTNKKAAVENKESQENPEEITELQGNDPDAIAEFLLQD